MSHKNATSPYLVLVTSQFFLNKVRAHHSRMYTGKIGLFYKICTIALTKIILPGAHIYPSFSLSPDPAFHNDSFFCDFIINVNWLANSNPGSLHAIVYKSEMARLSYIGGFL